MAFSSFFSSKKKVLKVVVEGKGSQEIRVTERDPIDKVIDKIKTKFELTDEETVDFNIQVSLRGVWATPDQTIGDLLLRNNDQILFARQPKSYEQPQLGQQGSLPQSARDVHHHSVPGGKLYPAGAGDDWVVVNDGHSSVGNLNTDPGASALRQSFSDGNLHSLVQDPRLDFLSRKTYISTGKVTLDFPSRLDPSLLQIPPEVTLLLTKEIPQPSSCYFEKKVIEKINKEKSDFEQQEAEFSRYMALKKKIRSELQADADRAQQEADRERKKRQDEERRKKQEKEDAALLRVPDAFRGDIVSNRQKRQCYLDLVLDKNVNAEVAARASSKFAMAEANRSVFLHLCAMQIPVNVSELVAEEKTNVEEALNVAFGLCPLVEKYPALSVQEIQKINAAHSTISGVELDSFIGTYIQMKGMGFACEHILSAIVQHPRDPAAALDLLLNSAP